MNLSYMLVLLQVGAALAGGIMTFRAKVDADKTEAIVIRAAVNGGRRSIARKNVRTENVIFAIQVSLFLIGIATLWLGVRIQETIEVEYVIGMRSVVMAFISFILMWLSYRNWVELTPVMALRRSDAAVSTDAKTGLANVVSSAKIAQDLAASAQMAAAGAQTAASDAQSTASEILESETAPKPKEDGHG